ncbi:MAG: hypothetical protein H6767_07090 [Candidatus Peribacteria bacterium]|nr:MAG: hypothetical protein H6767_07090 [Candidatus Peribacteria bacterium]
MIENGIEKGYTVIKELDIQGLEKLRREKPELDSIYTTIFLSIPAEKLKERIESRGVLMQNEEFERRKQTAIEEQKKAQELCDVMIDATQPPDEVFTQVCDIITKTK